MFTSRQSLSETRGPIIQFYNDRLANPVNLQLDTVNEDIEDYLDIFAELALQLGGHNSRRRVVTTWSHFLRATGLAQSRPIMSVVPLSCSSHLTN